MRLIADEELFLERPKLSAGQIAVDPARREVGEEKFRVWRIYMAGSAHAFDRGWLSLWQLLAGKPLADGRLPHPLTREYMYE